MPNSATRMTLRPPCGLLLGFVLLLIVAIRIQAEQQQQQQEHNQQASSDASGRQQEAAPTSKQGSKRTPEGEGDGSVGAAAGIAGYLLAEPTDRKLNSSDGLDSTLANILDRIGPDMRPLRDFRDFDGISLEVAKRAWKLMHDHAHAAVVGRLKLVRPIVLRALEAANVSGACLSAAVQTMDAAQRLDSWAIQLLTAWGNFPPTGIFEGTFGDIGSFHGCVNVPQNQVIGHAHYCTIAYRPVLPVRDAYELIVRGEPEELLRLFARNSSQDVASGHQPAGSSGGRKPTQLEGAGGSSSGLNEDAFSELLRHAQYNHYLYYKFGTCFPIQCSPHDVQRLARLVGKQSILMSGPVKCHSKFGDDYEEQQVLATPGYGANGTAAATATAAEMLLTPSLKISTRDLNNGVYIWKPHITSTQKVSLIIISIVSLFIVSMTLVDLALIRLPQLCGTITRERRLDMLAENQNNGNGLASSRPAVATCSGLPQTVTNGKPENSRPHIFDANNNMGLRELNGCLSAQPSKDTNSFGAPQMNGNTGETEEDSVGDIEETIMIGGGGSSSGGWRQKLKQPKCDSENANAKTKKSRKNGSRNREEHRSLFMQLVDDCSIVTNGQQFFHISQNQLNNDILCINGIRCITMSWIIITHTMQYNDWSAFARTREIETHLKSLINQPLFNGSYLVDTFFLVSGLLTSLSSFRDSSRVQENSTPNGTSRNGRHSGKANGHSGKINGTSSGSAASYVAIATTATANANETSDELKHTREEDGATGGYRSLLEKFSPRSYLIGRYLRLTPQVMLVSLLFILLPLLSESGGPHWYTITGEYSENCSQNWWLNLFYIQAFYRSNEMCNFVCWWISVDMFYHLFALMVILLILYHGHKAALLSCSILVSGHWIIQATKHYQLGLPPNLLSTIPQTGAMWSKMTLESFWTPYAHAYPFFLGLYLGYLISKRNSSLAGWFTETRAIVGWILATCLLVLQSYSTYYWVTGQWRYTRLEATLFYLVGPIIWATCLSWIILACQYGFGGWINSMLSCKLFIILGKASYIVYLSHFLVIFSFFGSQNLLLEPTQLVMLYVVIGNICLSMILGCCLYVVYEMPWLKAQKRIMKYV